MSAKSPALLSLSDRVPDAVLDALGVSLVIEEELAVHSLSFAASNLHEYDTIHAMLRLDEVDVYLFMASATAVSAPLLWLLERRGIHTPFGGKLSLSRSLPQAHHIKGGALFGIGWTIAGTCPAPALVMVSSGALLGLVAIPGIFPRLHIRERQQMSGLRLGDGEHRDLAPADR